MRVILKAGVQTARDPDFAMELGSLIVPFQYHQLQSLIWSWQAENASFTGRITETRTQIGQVDIIHSTDPICIYCPRGARDSLRKWALAVLRYGRPLPQPIVSSVAVNLLWLIIRTLRF
jgi:hypothetical protein